MHLFPQPQRLQLTNGTCNASETPQEQIDPKQAPTNGYRLSITSGGIEILAANESAAFHANVTLKQIYAQNGNALPCLEIEDWPDLSIRGYMLDISRCKVPTQESLYELIDLLASLKFNQLQLYTEHTFAYSGHQEVWQAASPITAAEIKDLDAYCQDRYIELVPNQNSFGHMERWLKHASYQHLAESPNGFEHPIAGWKNCGSTLKPTKTSAEFVDSLFAELLPNFTSHQLNVGGDEPWELGQGSSQAEVESRGKTRVYLDHLLRIQEKVQNRGSRMQFWGDIIINQPELAKELSPETTALLWGYETDHPFSSQCQAMHDAGVDFYVVPGTSTWNSIGGRLYTAKSNIEAACDNAKRFGAKGLLLTDWGDNGHHQSYKLSFLPIIHAAGTAWNKRTDSSDLESVATKTIPDPLSDSEYRAIIEMSSIAGSFSKYLHNGSWLNKVLFAKESEYTELAEFLFSSELSSALERLEAIEVSGELALSRDLLIHAARKGIAIKSNVTPGDIPSTLIERFESYWLSRNRPGGLEESRAYFSA